MNSTLFIPSQRALMHCNPPDGYNSDSSDSDSSSESSVEDGEEALEKDEDAGREDEESAEESDDDDNPSISTTNYLNYEFAEDRSASALAPTEDSEADSPLLTRESFDTEDFSDTGEETEDDLDDYLSMALKEDVNENEASLEERDFEESAPPPVQMNGTPAPLTYVEDLHYTAQPSLPSLPVPKARARPHKPIGTAKSKGKAKHKDKAKSEDFERSVNSVSVDEHHDAEYFTAEWERQRMLVKTQYAMPFKRADVMRPASGGNALPRPKKRPRVLSQTQQIQSSEHEQSRTTKRARLDQDGEASTSAKTDSPILPGGSASAKSSSQQMLDEVAKSKDYRSVLVPKTGKANYYARLLEQHPCMEGETFFAKELRFGDGTVIDCPVTGCGASTTFGKLEDHVRCHKNSEGKFTCSTKSHKAPKSFASEKAMTNHIIKSHLGHYLCPHCDKELTPEMYKFVIHLMGVGL
ncbi:hypothetical protein CPB85DRAFT_348670 [Mucidula mucida]|nr:hypothetical protein CPB85DRAFT_348670 [Mucidula mucida]